MPVKFSIGLGSVSRDPASVGGSTVTIFSGTVRPGILGGTDALVQVGPDQIDPTTVVSSQSSTTSFHPTLFEDFRLDAEAVYNFYTPDEQLTVSQDPSASLQSLPRYVSLSWRTVPYRTVDIPTGRKGVRPPDPRIPSIGPALDVSTAKRAVSNGYVSPGAVQVLLVPPTSPFDTARFDEDGFLLAPTMAGASAPDHLISGSEFTVGSPPSQGPRTRVTFVDPSIAGALDPNRIAVAADHAHLATLGALAKITPGLEVISEFNQDVPPRNPPPAFPITSAAPTLSYVGYVVERHTFDQSGSMVLTRTFDVSDPSVGSLVDRDVAYGGRYAYRIRPIVQWVHPANVTFAGPSTLDRLPKFDVSAPMPQSVATFYAGEWSDWSRCAVVDTSPPDPPDELTVWPRSRQGHIRIVWKMPADPQRDIASLVLLRADVSSAGTGDWRVLDEFIPANGAYVDSDVMPFPDGHVSYVYAMYSTSFHGEVSRLSEQLEARIGRRTARAEFPLVQVRPRGSDLRPHASGTPRGVHEPLVARERATFFCRSARSAHPLFNKSYVVEVQSLSTGERAEVDLSVDATDVGVQTAVTSGRA